MCAFNDSSQIQHNTICNSYSAWSLSPDIRKKTTSGGVAYELARSLLNRNYKVCAVQYNIEKQRAEHYLSITVDDLEKSQGSKYLQSYTPSGFRLLNKNDKFVVVGTPCQIDSVRRLITYWGVEDNYVLIDFFCHGVPSMNLWKSYLKYVDIKGVEDVRFRCKDDGWQESTYMVIKGKEKEWHSKLIDGDLFYRFFLGDRCLNNACYDNCKYKTVQSAADIRVGDMWGPKYSNNQNGVSAVITFSKRGDDILRNVSSCHLSEESLKDVLGTQMRANAKKPASYQFVKRKLKTSMNLDRISVFASFLELPDTVSRKMSYYWNRLRSLVYMDEQR